MTWKKRIISIALCLCALLCADSVRAEAADHSHPICGGTTGTTCTHAGEKHTSNVTWTAWNGTGNITYTNNVAYIYLSDDVTLQGANPLTVPKDQTLYLCLNGHSIEMKHDGGYWAIDVEGGNLILCDCKNTGTITQVIGNSYKGRGVKVEKKDTTGGKFTMYGGSITGNKGGVEVGDGCTFTMYGGSITQNAAGDDSGGGVYVYKNGTFTMYNGEISHNSAYIGGGVYNKGKFTMSNGMIVNNTAKSDGGGVHNDGGEFTMSDGEISGNSSENFAGGVRNLGKFTMSGGKIINNTAANNGGGVHNYNGTFNISGNVTITGNKKGSVANNVYLSSGKTITLAGALGENASIHVTTSKTPSSSPYFVDITAANDPNLVTAAKNKFTYDNEPSRDIVTRENGTILAVCKHSYGSKWTQNTDASSGHWRKCTNCDTIETATHSWNGGAVTTPATCTTPGEKTFTCTACSATKTETIGAKGHDFSVRQYGENDHWMKCSRCDATDTKEAHSGGEATCTQKAVCEKCGQKYGGLKAHDFANGPYQYDGEQHWYKCANCTATTESVAHTDFTAWKSDRSGHWHECSTCGYKTAVNAHTPDRDKATETTPQLCTECGYVIAPATHPVHTWVFVAETPATCNAAGEREHYKCTCGRTSFKNGDVYDINEDASVLTIAANHTGNIGEQWHSDSANHWQEYTCCHARANETAHSGGAATCTAQAVCQVCGKAYGPLAAHAWQPATCTAPKTCTACHVTDGAALGHDWGAWKVTTPATKDAPGVETRTCAHNSAHTETRSIPKLSTAVYTVSEDTKIAQIEAKVDGLDKILESNENKALVNDGKSVGVSLTVKNTASSGVSEKIKEKLAGSNLVGLRLELTVEKTVTANGVVEWKQTILDAGVLLKTTITLPAELQGKSGYVVYRLHDGNVHVLTETANENEEFISVSADKTQITICARLYSEYVIAYQTGGSSGGGYHPVNPTPVKATSANTGDAGVLLYGVTAALSLTGTAWLGAKSRKH